MAGLITPTLPSSVQYLDFLQMGVMVIDDNYRIVHWNRWLEEHSDIPFKSVVNLTFTQAFPDLVGSRLADVIQQAIDEKLSALISASLNQSLLPLYPSTNHQVRQMDLMRQMVQVSAIADENGKRFALLQITNMTNAVAKEAQLREQSQTIQHLVNVDDLTSVANRRRFDAALQEEFSRAKRAGTSLVLGFIDVDHFKLFNEHYGESYGNQCLAEVASTFEYALNRSSDLVARYSGQVFAVIMPCTTFEGAVNIAEAIRLGVKELQLRNEVSTIASHVTVSVGFAIIHPAFNDPLEAFVEAANFALMQAKQAGGNKSMIYAKQDGSLHACEAVINVSKFVEA